MQEISNSIESIMIQGGVGREENELHLSNLPSLITLEIGSYGFCNCNTIVIESMNDWINDEWDMIRLQSIILGSFSFEADIDDPAIESSSLNNEEYEWYDIDQIFLLWLYSKEMVTISDTYEKW